MMTSDMRTVLIAMIAFAVGAAGAVAFGMLRTKDANQRLLIVMQEKDQAQQGLERLQRSQDEAIRRYSKDLGAQVTAAVGAAGAAATAAPPIAPGGAVPSVVDGAGDPARVIEAARAVVAARDAHTASIDRLRDAMNSEFDALGTELGNPQPDARRLKEILDTLKQTWPAKEGELDRATQGLMGDLGLVIVPATLKPPIFSPPGPAPTQPPR